MIYCLIEFLLVKSLFFWFLYFLGEDLMIVWIYSGGLRNSFDLFLIYAYILFDLFVFEV